MTGYKNAPHITPQVGDVVKFGEDGKLMEVSSIGKHPTDPEAPRFINVSFHQNGKEWFHLNEPETVLLVRAVDGQEPTMDQTIKQKLVVQTKTKNYE